jgi:hypothetical protein
VAATSIAETMGKKKEGGKEAQEMLQPLQMLQAKQPLQPLLSAQPVQILSVELFIAEVLKRSRASYSTLLAAMLYLGRAGETMRHSKDTQQRSRNFERKLFVAALLLSSKCLHDRHPSNSHWSQITGLPLSELYEYERLLLRLLEYRTFIPGSVFQEWTLAVFSSTSPRWMFRASWSSETAKKKTCQEVSDSFKMHRPAISVTCRR